MSHSIQLVQQLFRVVSQMGKADATGLDPVEEADMNNIKTTGRWPADCQTYRYLPYSM